MNTSDAKEQASKWSKVQKMIEEKNPGVPYLTMGELCLEANNKTLAIMAIRKEKRYEMKIQMLIDAEAWFEATEETFS